MGSRTSNGLRHRLFRGRSPTEARNFEKFTRNQWKIPILLQFLNFWLTKILKVLRKLLFEFLRKFGQNIGKEKTARNKIYKLQIFINFHNLLEILISETILNKNQCLFLSSWSQHISKNTGKISANVSRFWPKGN